MPSTDWGAADLELKRGWWEHGITQVPWNAAFLFPKNLNVHLRYNRFIPSEGVPWINESICPQEDLGPMLIRALFVAAAPSWQ